MSGNDYRIAVVERTLDLLEVLAEASTPLGVSDLARSIGATKSAVFRLLVNLERRGYVSRDPISSKYQLGGELVRLGQRALESSDVRAQARSVLVALHDRFNETVNLAVYADALVTYVDMIESDQGLRMAARVGVTEQMHSTSLGKAILSFLPPDELERILARPLLRQTERTITDPQLLRAELETIRQVGFAEDRGENEVGARCFGSPVFDHRGRVVAAVSVASPESRVDDARGVLISRAVCDAAAEITSRLGGRWPIERGWTESPDGIDNEASALTAGPGATNEY